MLKVFFSVFNFLNSNFKKKTLVFYLFLLISTFLEAFSIYIIFPALNFIINPDQSIEILSYLQDLNIFDIKGTIAAIYLFLIFYLVLSLVKTSFMLFFTSWNNNFVFKIEHDLAKKLYGNYLNFSLEKFGSLNTSELQKNIIIEIKRARVCVDIFLRFFVDILIIFSLSTILFLHQPFSTLVIATVAFTVGLILNLVFRKKMFSLGEADVKYTAKIFSSIREGFSSFKSILIENKQKIFIDDFSKFFWERCNAQKLSKIIQDSIKIYIEFVSILILIVLIYILIINDSNLKNLIPTLTLYAAALYRLMPAASRVVNHLQSIENSKASIKIIEKGLKDINKNKDKKISEIKFLNKIFFDNISFKYKLGNNKVIKNLSFTINKNDFIVISGLSGLGKTTFIDLLSGLLKPTKGKIKIDKKTLSENTNWRKSVGYVPQSVYVLDRSIKDNIIFGNKTFNKKRLSQAIKYASLDNFVKNINKGINYNVGENGSKLSGGQIQRLGIARSLYRMPEILICDEITSSVDKITEKKILDTLLALKSKLTIIFITHRPEIINNYAVKKFVITKDYRGNSKLKKIKR